jgi:excinuclease UvrABC ATPase subunit
MELKRIQDELDKLPDFSNDSYLTEYTECKRKYDDCVKLIDTLRDIFFNVDECFCLPKEIEEERCRREASNTLIQSTIDSMKKGTCDVCLSTVTDDQYNARVEELQKQIKPLYDVDIDEMKREYKKEVQGQLKFQLEYKIELKDELDIMEHEKNQYTKWLELKEDKVRLKTYLDGFPDKTAPKVISDANVQIVTDMLEKKESELSEMKDRHIKILTNHAKCMKLERHLNRQGITSYILDNVSNRLEFMVNERLGSNYFEIERSASDRIVKKFKGSSMSLMSGGEHQKLKIATFLAYRKLIQEQSNWKCNLVIFDEPDTYVDASGLKTMMNMIKAEGKDMCTMVISHSSSMHRDMDLFDNHIEIERDHNGSRKRKRI